MILRSTQNTQLAHPKLTFDALCPARRVAADLMMCCDSHGRILYITTALANYLNYEPRELVRTNLSTLLNPPFNTLHTKYMKSPPAKVPLNSCRGNFTVTIVPKGKPSIPIRCKIDTREINEQQVYVVQVEPSSFDVSDGELGLLLQAPLFLCMVCCTSGLLGVLHEYQQPCSSCRLC